MKKFLSKLWWLTKRAACVAGAALLVIKYPPVAIGFMAAYVAKHGRNPYESVILGSAAAAVAVIVMLNFAEIAVLATAFPVGDLFQSWAHHVEAA